MFLEVPLYDLCIEEGYIDKDTSILNIADNTNDYIIKNPHYSSEHISEQTYLMNLEVNFVKNYRMKQGDYVMAERAFKDVLKRYSHQAFAQYYLGKALDAQGKYPEAQECYENMFRIIEETPIWKTYFDYFNVDYTDVRKVS